MEKKKKVEKSTPEWKWNPKLSLKAKLEKSGEPALGLEFITEFIHPEKLEKDHPMYSCSLEGCKSAWGTSFEMLHHVLNVKHQRNFLRSVFPEDATIQVLPKSDILLKVHVISNLEQCAGLQWQNSILSRQCSGRSRSFQMRKTITARLCRLI